MFALTPTAAAAAAAFKRYFFLHFVCFLLSTSFDSPAAIPADMACKCWHPCPSRNTDRPHSGNTSRSGGRTSPNRFALHYAPKPSTASPFSDSNPSRVSAHCRLPAVRRAGSRSVDRSVWIERFCKWVRCWCRRNILDTLDLVYRCEFCVAPSASVARRKKVRNTWEIFWTVYAVEIKWTIEGCNDIFGVTFFLFYCLLVLLLLLFAVEVIL